MGKISNMFQSSISQVSVDLIGLLIESVSVLSSLYSCIGTQGAVDNKSHYLCSPQARIPAAWEDASGSRRPRGFQPPCCLAHNRRDHQTRHDRNRLSLYLQSPNQCRGSLIGDFIVNFKQKTIYFCFLLQRVSQHLVGNRNRKLKTIGTPSDHKQKMGTGNTAHWCQRATEIF